MINKITPLVKGLITGVLMLAITLSLIYSKQSADGGLSYLVYAVYAGGIAWTLIAYSRSPNYNPSFGSIFGQGFRCFIVVVLVIVTFTAVYGYMHPEIAEEAAKLTKESLLKEGAKSDKTPAEIDIIAETIKKQYITSIISQTIFGTLLTGAIFTAAGAGLLLMRKK